MDKGRDLIKKGMFLRPGNVVVKLPNPIVDCC